jgi:serine protease Do
LARDPVLDVAFVKINATGLPYLQLDDSDTLQVGQSVIAIGNALGEFKNTVSVGVVSGLSRSITAGDETGQTEQLDKVIQTDAAINPGNSGGPLLDLAGNVVGINVAVVQGSSNIGFALPINSVKNAINSFEKTGKISRPYVGIRYIDITADVKAKNNLSVDYGILVQRGATASEVAVIPGSPADKAGIVENDIILSVDGQNIDQDHDFSNLIRSKSVGDTVQLGVLSKGLQKTVTLKLEQAPDTL